MNQLTSNQTKTRKIDLQQNKTLAPKSNSGVKKDLNGKIFDTKGGHGSSHVRKFSRSIISGHESKQSWEARDHDLLINSSRLVQEDAAKGLEDTMN